MGARVLVVGWDGAERDLVDRWTRGGRLPTLAALRSRGTWREVAPADGFGDDAAWASFSTALPLGTHARAYRKRIAPGGRDVQRVRRRDLRHPPFWDGLASAGARVAVVDVPKSPIGADRSLVVADWMPHGPDEDHVMVTWPDLATRFARDPDWTCDALGRGTIETRAYEHALLERAVRRGDALVDLLAEREWDLFLAVFAEPHCVGHQCWHDHDPTHPEHDAKRRAECGDVVEHVYRATDAQLSRLLDAAGPDAIVVVFSLLGMGTNHTGEHLLEELLTGLDAGVPRRSLELRLLDGARRAVPIGVRRRAPRPLRHARTRATVRERSRRPAWSIPTDLPTSAIRVGVAGRDDGGTIARGSALTGYLARLRDELQALRDPETGRALVVGVTDVAEAHGPRVADEFADLMVSWSQEAPITAARSPSVGTLRCDPPPVRTGNHRPHGWAVVTGRGVDPGAPGDPLEVVELAPTITRLVDDSRRVRGRTDGADAPGSTSP